jgi:hypothetical protein
MGSKNNPGKWDCYANAEPDEPMFVLLGRDPIAPFLVGWWVGLKAKYDPTADEEKLKEALVCAHAMEEWLLKMNREDKLALRKLVMEEGMRIVKAIDDGEAQSGEAQSEATGV